MLHLHSRPVTLVKYNHDGDLFLTCGKDGEANLCRSDTCERIGTYSRVQGEKEGALYAIDVTMDSKYVVTAGADGKLVFYTLEGELQNTVSHGGILKFVEWNQKPGQQNMVVTCNDKFKSSTDGNSPNRIMVWQFQPVKRLLCIDEALPTKATRVRWGPFDETLVSIHEEGGIHIWDAMDGRMLKMLDAHKSPCTNISFNHDRMLMISTSKDQTAKLWAMDKYDCIKTYQTDRPLNDASISPLADDSKADSNPRYHVLLGGGQDAKDVTTTASSSGKFEVVLWNMIFEEEIGSIKGGFGPCNTLDWARDGKGFVTGGEDGYVRVHHFDSDYDSKKFD